jgi:hypothetical protein
MSEDAAFQPKSRVQVTPHPFLDGFEAACNRQWSHGQHGPGELTSSRQQVLRWNNLVDQSKPKSFSGIDSLAGEEQLQGG